MPESSASVGILIAFTAGLLSFLSPCVLPLIPSYVTFITGLNLEDVQRARRTTLVHSLLFILGFTLIFLTLGATATLLGRVLLTQREWISRIGGLLIIVFGLYMLGAFNVAILSQERRVHLADKPLGYLGTVLVGVAFGAGWTPCIGPVLAGILTMAAASETMGAGMAQLLVYSLGLAVPFLLAALLLDRFLIGYKSFRRWLPWVERVSGALLILVGILLVTGTFTVLSGIMAQWTPDFILDRI